MKDHRSISSNWCTPDWLFDQLNEEFNFDIDLCATAENSKCKWSYCTDYLSNKRTCVFPGKDGNHLYATDLELHLDIVECAFINPPYSNPKPFIEKAWEDSKHCKIVSLVKCDPSTQWWATFWDYGVEKYRCTVCQKQGDVVCRCSFEDFRLESYIYNGPKPGCQVRFFPKRIQFDPPQEWIDRGSVKIINGKWYILKYAGGSIADPKTIKFDDTVSWERLSGPTFPCALIIMDRRGL